MLRGRETSVFIMGALCGAALAVASGLALIWWRHPTRSVEDNAIYDQCLSSRNGNTVACDAMMRLLEQERLASAALKYRAAQLLAAGFTKREVVKWALKEGFKGSDVADVVGISLEDLQQGKF
jgi:hypothetical protein